MMLCEVGQY